MSAVDEDLPLVGRDRELEFLDRLLRSTATTTNGGGILITGEAGIGKSRLLRESRRLAAAAGLTVLSGHSVENGGAYRALVAALSRRSTSVAQDARLAPVRASLARILPSWLTFVESAPAPAPLADPTAVMGDAISALLDVMAPKGCALVLDDLQWADRDTLAVLDYLVDVAQHQPVVMIMAARDQPELPSELARLLDARRVTGLSLSRLRADDVVQLISSRRGSALGAPAVRQVVEAADGLPVIIEEILRQLGDTWDADTVLHVVPASIATTVQHRLAALSGPSRAVLDALSITDEVNAQVLMNATGLTEHDVARGLRDGIASTLLVSSDTPTGTGWRHQLIRDSVNQHLLPIEQQSLARSIADAVTDGIGSGESGYELAASLYRQAERHQEAAYAYVAAARSASARGALLAADHHLAAAIALTRPGTSQAARLITERLQLMILGGRGAEVYEIGRAAASAAPDQDRTELVVTAARGAIAADRHALADALLAQLGDSRHPAILLLRAHSALARDEIDQAATMARTAAELAADHGQLELACEAWEVVGRAERMRNTVAAEAAFRRAFDLADRASLTAWKGRALAELGTVDLMRSSDPTRLLRARSIAEELGMAGMLAVLDLQIGACVGTRDGMMPAAARFVASLDRARRLRMTAVQAAATAFLAQVALHGEGAEPAWPAAVAGRDVAALVAEAIALGEASIPVPWARCTLGVQAWLSGDDHQAVQLLTISLEPLRGRQNQPQPPWWGLWALLRTVIDVDTSQAFDELATPTVQSHFCNRGALAYGRAVEALKLDNKTLAETLIATADTELGPAPFMQHLYRTAIAPVVAAYDHDRAEAWLREADAHCGAAEERALQHKIRAVLKAIGAKSPRSSPGTVPPRLAGLGVTARETEVLSLVAAGRTNAEIATLLTLSPRTVESHISNLLSKTGSSTRRDLARLAK